MVSVTLTDPTPVLVLHDGRWVRGRLLHRYRTASGWRGVVSYSVDGFGYYQARPYSEPRPVKGSR
jgi:hypothetical protein